GTWFLLLRNSLLHKLCPGQCYSSPENIPPGQRNVRRENARVTVPPPHMLKADTFLMSLWLFLPSILEIRLPPPNPKRFPRAVSRLNQGETRDTAATI